MKWYKNVYRRNLVDMHISDSDKKYMSEFSAEDYYDYLKKSKLQSPMIYLQSHTGLCNFPTKSGKTHEYFKDNPNEIKKLISLCKKGGMKVVGYYSLIFNNQAVIDHPEWEQVYSDGSTWRNHGQRYGLACPNNVEYREFVVKQIKELAEFYTDLDGIFFDMPYWEVVCHCPSCQKRWEKEVGGRLPKDGEWKDERWLKFVRKRQQWMVDFVKFVKEKTNEIMPSVTVEFNFAAVVGCDWLGGSTEGINEYCEFTGGDLYGDLYNHSFVCKYYYGITKNQPFEYMTCRCNKTLREHTVSKPENTLEAEIMLTAIHHGASLIIDAINPDGTLDKRVAERIGNIFKKQIPYEKYMNKGEMYGEVAVYFDSTVQFSFDGGATNKQCAIQTVRTMVQNHIPVSVVANGNLNDLNKYQVVVAPNLQSFDNPEVLKLIDYVKDGGTLYISGSSDSRLIKEFFDGEIIGETFGDTTYKHVYKGYYEVQCYVCPEKDYEKHFGEFNEKYPLPIIYKLPVIEHKKGKVKAKIVLPFTDPDNNTVYASIHSNPPAYKTEIPAIIETSCGKGKVIWSAAKLENDGRKNFTDLFVSLIKDNLNSAFDISASKYVESVIFKDGEDIYLGLLDLNFAEDLAERDFEFKIKDGKNYSVKVLLGKGEIKCNKNKISGRFSKYLSLLIKKER